MYKEHYLNQTKNESVSPGISPPPQTLHSLRQLLPVLLTAGVKGVHLSADAPRPEPRPGRFPMD